MNPLSIFVSDLHSNDRGDREISKIPVEIFACSLTILFSIVRKKKKINIIVEMKF